MSTKIKIGYSLDMINMHHQEPNRNRQESKYYWEELYPLVKAAGFKAIEIPFDPFWIFRGGSGVPFTKYCLDVKYGDIDSYTAHLKSAGINQVAGIHFDPSMFMRNSDLNFYFGASGHFGSEAVKYAIALGCDYINVTPTAPYGIIEHYHGNKIQDKAWLQDFLNRTSQMINEFGKLANEGGIKITLRSEYWSMLRGDKILDFVDKLDTDVLFDIDPANISITGIDPEEKLKRTIKSVGTVHLTDTAFEDNHDIWKTPNPQYPSNAATQVFRDLGFGNLNLKRCYDVLVDANYEGWVICSNRQTRDPMRALLRTRRFINNELISNGER